MLGLAGPSLGLFAAVIGFICLASSAVVTDALLRDCQPDGGGERPAPEN